jgi:hypothetical protein
MSRPSLTVAVTLLLVAASTAPARAQSAGAADARDSAQAAGRADGVRAARGVPMAKSFMGSVLIGGGTSFVAPLVTGRVASVGTTFGVGLAGGFLLGKIAGAPDLPDDARQRLAGESPAYRAAFFDAFHDHGGRRRTATMVLGAGVGAALGWLLFASHVGN